MRLKHKKFIEAYTAIGKETFGNGAKSALLAGYSPKRARITACELLKSPQIQKEISNIREQRDSQSNLTKGDYISHLWKARNNCKSESIRKQYDELIGKASNLLQDKDIQQVNILNKIEEVEQGFKNRGVMD